MGVFNCTFTRVYHKMSGKVIEGSRRTCQLNGIPTRKHLGIGARGNQPSRRIDGTNSFAERRGARCKLTACGISKVPIAPELIAKLPQQSGMRGPMLVDISNPAGSFLGRSASEIQRD